MRASSRQFMKLMCEVIIFSDAKVNNIDSEKYRKNVRKKTFVLISHGAMLDSYFSLAADF